MSTLRAAQACICVSQAPHRIPRLAQNLSPLCQRSGSVARNFPGGTSSFKKFNRYLRTSKARGNNRVVAVAATMTKKVLVPVANGSEEMEAVIIIDVLRRAGAEVVVASVEEGLEVVCSRKVKLLADALIGDVKDAEFDLIALPGGMPGAERLRDSAVLTDLLEKQRSADKAWTAICASPAVVFESKGWLAGKKATAHPAFADKLSDTSAVASRVVVDGKLITSRGPGTAFEFSLALVAYLYGEQAAKEVAGPMVMYDYEPAKSFVAA